MRSTTVPRPAMYRLSALFSSLALLTLLVSGQGPAKGDKADLVFSRWLEMVATLLAVRQPSRSAAQGVHPNDA